MGNELGPDRGHNWGLANEALNYGTWWARYATRQYPWIIVAAGVDPIIAFITLEHELMAICYQALVFKARLDAL